MRVITGAARGRKLITLEGDDVRPTSDMVKEAMFSILHFQIEGRRVLDLFAGSGQLGIEALSRGAAQVVFVDASRDSVDIVKKNLNSTDLEKNAKVLNIDFLSFLKQKNDKFDIALLDPPYRKGLLQQALPLLVNIMNTGGTILCESPKEEELPEQVGDFVRGKSYRYGKIMLTVYNHKDVQENENSDLPGQL